MNEKNIKLPFFLELEQSILGIIFLDPKKILVLMDKLETEDFFNIEHQYIYEAMKTLFKENKDIDYLSVFNILEKQKQKLADGKKYLLQLTNNIPSIYHLDTYIDFILDASLKREIITTASEIYNEGISNHDIDFKNFLDITEEKIFQISKKKKTSNLIDIKILLKDIIHKTIYNKAENKIIGLSTGFTNLDDITLGLKPEELIILAARPSMGKSTFMSNLAINIAKRNNKANIIIFSLEMSNEQLGSRMLSSETQISHKKIQLGFLNEEEKNLLQLASTTNLQNLNIFFNDSASANILDIRAQCRKMKNQNKLDFVIIDYLQLIGKSHRPNSKSFYNRQEEIADISKSLKQMARELKIPVLALSQLSREVEKREDKRPILSDLRDSGSIEQDADIVMFLYRPNYYNKELQNQLSDLGYTELIISKNRQGSVGIKKFHFNLSCLSFKAID
ncbi:replicative DNA helicase [Candidatus Phytoplasma fraxini]|uniref:Replicative DNA helicase n=1 Tax=Ash yellows phytoplasma TaxID=35780 RepID=A0ABZ2UBF5_ASHYP